MDNTKTRLMWYESILLCAKSICSLKEYVPLWSLSAFGFLIQATMWLSNIIHKVSLSLLIRGQQTGVLKNQRPWGYTQIPRHVLSHLWTSGPSYYSKSHMFVMGLAWFSHPVLMLVHLELVHLFDVHRVWENKKQKDKATYLWGKLSDSRQGRWVLWNFPGLLSFSPHQSTTRAAWESLCPASKAESHLDQFLTSSPRSSWLSFQTASAKTHLKFAI